ncbi:hypothetical protein [Macrococcus armenti]|uniref:hypothetical protein n=1 Tax=Macrococcus armenti TaxID=2875764 RepID=UPI001CCFD54D|nr:hypothetical protein [Macrococcus armenti]UBH08189.1 hypothetical protein LAU41_09370 [Macrococcus armenti]UBH10420.1 hypothetical protein LAU38_09290 [Macrococcus armenti]
MNEIYLSIKYIPHILKNALLEIYYNQKLYAMWLGLNILVIAAVFFFMNITESLPIAKITRVWQLSGYLMFMCIGCSIYYAMKTLKTRGYVLNITNMPSYVLITVQIVNFVLIFLISYIILLLIALSNKIEITTNIFCILFFVIMAIILLMPICTIIALMGYLTKNVQWIIGVLLAVILVTTPVLWVPGNLPDLLMNILKLNPFNFIINGVQESTLFGANAFLNLPSQVIFIFEIVIVYIWFDYLFTILKDEINVNKQERYE